MLDFIILVLLIVPIWTVAIIFHEIGHYIFMKRCGLTVSCFSIGKGRNLFTFEWNGTLFEFNAIPLRGGFVSYPSGQLMSFNDEIMITAGGPLFNLILGTVSAVLFCLSSSTFLVCLWMTVALVNFFIFVLSMIPTTIEGDETDGRKFLNLLRGKKQVLS